MDLHATRTAGSLTEKSVFVTGCGPIGIMSIVAARHAGANRIVATDLRDFTLHMARIAGADETINMWNVSDGLSSFNAEKGVFDVLFECSGSAQALTTGIFTMRPSGTIVKVVMGGDIRLPMLAITT